MKKENPIKLKKYLFLISIVFCIITFSHILYNYLYENSQVKAKKWWTISEWIIWKVPSLNPLKPISWNNEYILRLIYRSILKYDINQEKLVWDIAKCDISSLINIDCVINDNAKWSNWELIKADDIISTYNLIKETNSNPVIASLLKDVVIESKWWNRIIFKNKKKDTNFLNVFLQPIISQKTIDKLSKQNIEWNFPYNSGIYSWDYILDDIKTDENLWVWKITLRKNEESWDTNISKIDIYVFQDENSLKRNKQVVNVFNDTNNFIWDSIARLNSNRYNLPQFLAIFINTSKIENLSLRTFILNEINRENLIKLLWDLNYKEVLNPYFSDSKTRIEPTNKNLEAVMLSIWYKKKFVLLEDLKNEAKNKTKKEEKEKKEEKVEIKTLDKSKWIDSFQKDSITISSPDWVDKYNFITKDDFKLVWKTPKNVKEVYINDYKLKWYNPWDKEFFYRIKESYDNIKKWVNTYKIYFVIDWKKELKEEITFLYNKNRESLKEEEKKFINSLYEKEQAKINKKIEEEKSKKSEEKPKESEEEKLKSNIDKEKLKKIESLDDKLFYDKNLKPFSIDLVYLNTRKDFEQTAKFIKNSLKEIGITVNLKSLSKKEFWNALLEKKYDMILWWIDLWYFSFNIFPYFHSSQANSGFNYSAIKKTSLDLLLEEAKENIYNEEKTKLLENKILDILKKEQVVKTLYSPKLNLLIDKNIKLTKKFSKLPSESLRSEIMKESYIKQEKVFSIKGKSITWFVAYLFKKLYE